MQNIAHIVSPQKVRFVYTYGYCIRCYVKYCGLHNVHVW
jgi:hypothetical protein